VADLFEPEPAKWGLRGDPHVWRALRAHLADTQLPASAGDLQRLLYAAFAQLVGVDLAGDPDASVHRDEFAHGGMSSGMISLDTWRDRLMPMLVERATALLGG
jgi:hypothetical protein